MRGSQFKASREGLGLSIRGFSKLSGLAEASIKKFETGQFAIPAGMEQVFERVRAKVYATQTRWATLTVEEIGKAKAGWTIRTRGWDAYKDKEGAEEATEFFPELWAIPVEVRKLLDRTPMRELWEELRLAESTRLG